MLEELIEFKKSIEEDKGKIFVKRKFIKYCISYNEIKNPMKNEISNYNENLLEYLRYMEKSGESNGR